MTTEEAANDIMRAPERAAPLRWSVSRGYRAVALFGYVALYFGAGSIKLYRGPAWHRHHAVESNCRSRDGLADKQGAPLRPAGNGRGTVVGRHASNHVLFRGANILGVARGHCRLYGSGRNTASCRFSGRSSQKLGCRRAPDRDDYQFCACRWRLCRCLRHCGCGSLERFCRGWISFLDRRCNRHFRAPPSTASGVRTNQAAGLAGSR